jgi:hypothetical protein
LARETPSFAGFYLDASGVTILRIADTVELQRGVAAMRQHLLTGDIKLPKNIADRPIVAQKADYSFQQLSDWRDLVYEHILGMDGVAFDDLDEVRNRVTIGVSARGGAEAAVMKQLLALGIPVRAIHFEPAERSTPTVAAHGATRQVMNPGGDLLGPYDELGGGYVIYPSGCTAGFAADFYGARVLATASHCTQTRYHVDGGAITGYQINGSTIGTETYDPETTSSYCQWDGSGLGWGYHCYPARGSDAALYSMNGAMPTRRGAIARPTVRQHALLTNPQRVVNPTNPWFYVTSTEYGHPVGSIVEKVGRITGWTWGSITASCVDLVDTHDYAERCAIATDMWVGQGDSGAPVFMQDNPNDSSNSSVKLMGILSSTVSSTTWNGVDVGATSYYTSYRSFENELGVLDQGILNPISNVLSAPVLTGTLSGGSPVLSWNASGGTGIDGPVTYSVYVTSWDASDTSVPEQNLLETSVQSPGWTDTSPFFSFSTAPSGTRPSVQSCNSYSSYYVIAFFRGVNKKSNTLYYLGPRNNPNCS